MAKVIISRGELPIPVSDHINKFRYRVVNENRNIVSDWSVINYTYQETLDPNSRDGLPPTGNPGDVLTPIITDPDNWDIGWTPVGTWISDNDIVTTDNNYDVPAGGDPNDVLTKISGTDYDYTWLPAFPTDGEVGDVLAKGLAGNEWVTLPPLGSANPQEGNFIIGVSCFC